MIPISTTENDRERHILDDWRVMVEAAAISLEDLVLELESGFKFSFPNDFVTSFKTSPFSIKTENHRQMAKIIERLKLRTFSNELRIPTGKSKILDLMPELKIF